MIEVLKQALEALENNRQTHRYCEDTWYSCPKHEDGCANDSEGNECNCGADEANIKIDAAIASLRQAIKELESQEPVAWVCCGSGEKHDIDFYEDDVNALPVGTMLYTHPPQRTEQEPVAWLLTEKNINSLQVDSIQLLINRLKHAHHTDLCVRINGQDEWFQADWLKHMVRATPPQRTEQNFCPRCGKRTNDIHTCTPPRG